jgi:hypothetical protein
MSKPGRPLHPLAAWVMLGSCLGFGVASFAPLWEVRRPTRQVLATEAGPVALFSGVGPGTFWEFLGELPSGWDKEPALRAPGVATATPLGPRGWRNVRTTWLALAAGAGLGCAIWAFRFVPPLTPPFEEHGPPPD